MQRDIQDLYRGLRLDEVDSDAHVRIIGKVQEIFTTPGLLDLVDAYQITQREQQ